MIDQPPRAPLGVAHENLCAEQVAILARHVQTRPSILLALRRRSPLVKKLGICIHGLTALAYGRVACARILLCGSAYPILGLLLLPAAARRLMLRVRGPEVVGVSRGQ